MRGRATFRTTALPVSSILHRPLPLASALALVLAACVPIPQTATLSPALLGTLQREDRTPLAGARLALSVAHEDSTCRKPERFTTVDSAGRFEFPAVTKREGWTPVLFERLLSYYICVGEAGDPVYQASYLHSVPAAATLTCVIYDPPFAATERRTLCRSRPRRRR